MNEIISYGRFQCSELSPHKNKGMEITYVEKGMLEWMVEGVPEKLEPGSIFYTLPWQVHGSMNPEEPDNTVCHVLFHLDVDYPRPRKRFRFPQSFGFSAAEMDALSAVLAQSHRHSFRATPSMRFLVPTLINELQGTHELGAAHIITLLRAILVELKRIVGGEAVDKETHTWTEHRVQALLTKLPSSCDHRWTLVEMAAECGIQRTRLNDVVRRLTGSTPMEYLSRLRVERAKNLLRESDLKIIDIALECGFSSSQYFANTFRRATGLTPSAYRKHCVGLTPDDLRKWRAIGFRTEREERERVAHFTGE